MNTFVHYLTNIQSTTMNPPTMEKLVIFVSWNSKSKLSRKLPRLARQASNGLPIVIIQATRKEDLGAICIPSSIEEQLRRADIILADISQNCCACGKGCNCGEAN